MPQPEPAANVFDDIAAGEEPVCLSDLVKQPYVPRQRGRKPHISWAYRAAEGGLETATINGKKYTTRSAFVRWVAKQSGAKASDVHRSPARRGRDVARVDNQLANAGL